MAGSDVWRGVWVKTERAKEHVRDLEARVVEFMDRRPCSATIVREEATGHNVIAAQVNEQPPVWWGAIAGDAVHNLRAALDLLVYELVRLNGETPDEQTTFPIADTPEAYALIRDRKLRGVAPAVAALIDGVQPYRRGNFGLWSIEQLDAVDRHAPLIPIAAARKGLIDVISQLDFPGTPMIVSPGYPNRIVFPVENGTELARVSRAHREDQIEVRVPGVFYVAFGEPGVLAGEPLIPTLHALVRVTESTIQPIIRPFIQG